MNRNEAHAMRLLVLTAFAAAWLGGVAKVGLSAQESEGRSSLLVIVVDADSRRPLSGVTVALGDVQTRITDRYGRAVFLNQSAGPHLLMSENLGYATRTDTVSLLPREPIQVNLSLVPEAIQLEGLEVAVRPIAASARVAQVLEHVARGRGQVLLRDDIDRMGNPPVNNLLQRMQGIRMRRLSGYNNMLVPVIRSARDFDGSICYPVLFIDGHQIDLNRDPDGAVELNVLSGSELEALEVYANAGEVPADFHVDRSRCGVIAVWTH